MGSGASRQKKPQKQKQHGQPSQAADSSSSPRKSIQVQPRELPRELPREQPREQPREPQEQHNGLQHDAVPQGSHDGRDGSVNTRVEHESELGQDRGAASPQQQSKPQSRRSQRSSRDQPRETLSAASDRRPTDPSSRSASRSRRFRSSSSASTNSGASNPAAPTANSPTSNAASTVNPEATSVETQDAVSPAVTLSNSQMSAQEQQHEQQHEQQEASSAKDKRRHKRSKILSLSIETSDSDAGQESPGAPEAEDQVPDKNSATQPEPATARVEDASLDVAASDADTSDTASSQGRDHAVANALHDGDDGYDAGLAVAEVEQTEPQRAWDDVAHMQGMDSISPSSVFRVRWHQRRCAQPCARVYVFACVCVCCVCMYLRVCLSVCLSVCLCLRPPPLCAAWLHMLQTYFGNDGGVLASGFCRDCISPCQRCSQQPHEHERIRGCLALTNS